VTRGISRQDIFCDQDDYQRFLGILDQVKTDKFEVYGYCLISNHVHLLIHEKSEEIHQIMKRACRLATGPVPWPGGFFIFAVYPGNNFKNYRGE